MNINNIPRLNQLNSDFKPEFTTKVNYNYSLEGLRGLAALFVLSCHAFGYVNALDPSYTLPKFLHYFHSARGAVLIFFILSGYVIGLTNTQDFSYKESREYLFRRGVRLIPIYWIAIILTVCVSSDYKIGKISCGLYLLHLPLMKLIHDYFPNMYQGTIITFALRFIVWILITIGVSVLLELVMQPIIKKFCYQKFIF